MSNEKIILSIRRPEIREHFYFKFTLTTFNISINHTQKELERAIEVLKSHDLLEFNRTIEKVKNKEQLKDVLRASFDIWSGDKLEWLQYTKKKVKRPFGNSVIEDAGYTNLWNDWFNEMELKYKNDIETKPIKSVRLSDLITHEKSIEIVEKIKVDFKNIKGKRLKLLYQALMELNLLPKERHGKKFHDLCQKEFDWNIAKYQSMNDYKYNELTDKSELTSFKEQIKQVMNQS
jgi:hypothetical protein